MFNSYRSGMYVWLWSSVQNSMAVIWTFLRLLALRVMILYFQQTWMRSVRIHNVVHKGSKTYLNKSLIFKSLHKLFFTQQIFAFLEHMSWHSRFPILVLQIKLSPFYLWTKNIFNTITPLFFFSESQFIVFMLCFPTKLFITSCL